MTKTTLRGPGGVTLILDPAEIDWKDPGNGCPALVEKRLGRFNTATASYNCAMGEGILDGGNEGDVQLTDVQLEWLDKQEPEINRMYDEAQKARTV